jgi:ankyrin repeat protein
MSKELNGLNYNLIGGGSKLNTSNLVLKAFSEKKPEIASFILINLGNDCVNIEEVDIYGRNILHYLVIFNNYITFQNLFMNILEKKSKFKKMCNIQDKLGNTPLHYAVMFNLNNIADLLIKNGANAKLKNNEGDYVQTDNEKDIFDDMTIKDISTETVTEGPKKYLRSLVLIKNKKPQVTSLVSTVSDISDLFLSDKNISNNKNTNNYNTNRDSLTDVELNAALNKIVKSYARPESDTFQLPTISQMSFELPTMTQQTQNSDKEQNSETLSFLKNIQQQNTEKESRTDEVAMNFLQRLKDIKETNPNKKTPQDEDILIPVELTVLPHIGEPPSEYLEPTTATMIKDFRNEQKKDARLIGGKKSKKSKGIRKIYTFSEMSYGDPITNDDEFKEANKRITSELFDDKKKSESSESSESTKKLTSELSEMARNIEQQSTKIHERSIEKIAELMKLDLKNPEDNKKARYYKAALWRMIKEKHPELSNYDRSVEMEKNITKEILKTINIQKVSEDIEKYFSEKVKTSSEETVEKPKKATKTKVEKVEKPKKATKTKVEKVEKPKKGTKAKKTKDEGSNKTLSISTETLSAFSETSESSMS